jgi:CHAD domain-containing protein
MADGKWIEGLSPDMEVPHAARAVIVARFQVVRHCLPLAVEKSLEDTEYVHQLRVSTRRAAAALRVFADC